MQAIATLVSGLLFGLGLVESGLINPAKVLNFLDVAGTWDASLALTMGAAVVTTGLGYRIAFAKPAPLFGSSFHVPTATAVDARLVTGAALFGIGWGLVGYCPGPAIAALSAGSVSTFIFVAAMLAGMATARRRGRRKFRSLEHRRCRIHWRHPMTTIPHSVDLSVKPEVTAFFDEPTNTVSYVVKDPSSNACAVIDSVMDIDYAAGRISYQSADEIIRFVQEHGLKVEWLIETHAHADHLSAAPYIQGKLGGKLGIGENIKVVQEVFGKIFNEGTEFQRDGSQFDQLFKDGDTYQIGGMTAFAMLTPGHTPACMTHVVGDAAFVGDTLFMPDGGTARADFPGGDARVLYRSIKRVLELPPETRLFMCHDYAPGGREIKWETSVAEERAHNIHVRDGVSEDEFVKMREARDKTLELPKLIIPSIQVNIRGGNLPEPDETGKRHLKVPINEL